jgi:hypothetical protein
VDRGVAVVVVIAVLGVAAIAAILWLVWRAEQKRTAALRAFVTAHGLTYTERDDRQCAREGSPFGIGDTRRATHVVNGRDTLSGSPVTRDFVAFDYSYVTTSSNGKSTTRTTHHYAVLVVRLPTWLPTVQVTEENVFHRIGGLLGFEDITLESEDFNRRFRVTADDRKLAYDVLPARTMEALMGRKDVALRIQNSELIAWDGGRIDPEGLAGRLATSAALLDGIPDFVWADHGRSQP